MYYRVCPYCAAHLDPGERCDCQGKKREAAPLPRVRPQTKMSTDSVAGLPMKVKRTKGVIGC